MDHAAQVTLLNQLFELRNAKSTSMAASVRHQSTSVYRDQDHLERELDVLFRGAPLIAGLSCDLPMSGDYFTVELGTSSVVAVRSENGQVRAFLNACRHRGSRLAEGRGPANRVFRCPYHAWVYDIDGRLLASRIHGDLEVGVS